MTSKQFDTLYARIGHHYVLKRNSKSALTPRERMMSAIHWLSQGNPYHGAGDMHGVSKSTICRNVAKFAGVVIRHMFRDEVKFPDNLIQVATEFYKLGKMPCVAGCVNRSMYVFWRRGVSTSPLRPQSGPLQLLPWIHSQQFASPSSENLLWVRDMLVSRQADPYDSRIPNGR